jgi:hypothetical protein
MDLPSVIESRIAAAPDVDRLQSADGTHRQAAQDPESGMRLKRRVL